jgi:hypothetical protein
VQDLLVAAVDVFWNAMKAKVKDFITYLKSEMSFSNIVKGMFGDLGAKDFFKAMPGLSPVMGSLLSPMASLMGQITTKSTQNTVTVDTIQVNTTATDAAGIAKDIGGEFKSKFMSLYQPENSMGASLNLANQADGGM